MDKQMLESLLGFISQTEPLKNTLRSAHTSNGRQESTAEHSWRLALMVMLFADYYPEVDALKCLKLALIHDLGEVIHGDIPAVEQTDNAEKNRQEREDFLSLIQGLPEKQKNQFLSLWDEYDQAITPEARLVKAFDKLETILQHTQGQNPDNFDYAFNLHYGKRYTDADSITADLRTLIDTLTQKRMIEKKEGTPCTR